MNLKNHLKIDTPCLNCFFLSLFAKYHDSDFIVSEDKSLNKIKIERDRNIELIDFHPHPQCNYQHKLKKTKKFPSPSNFTFLKRKEDNRLFQAKIYIETFIANVPHNSDFPTAYITGTGTSRDKNLAKKKALMELLERYSLFTQPRCEISRGPNISRNIISAEDLLRSKSNNNVWWCKAKHITDKTKSIYVSAKSIVFSKIHLEAKKRTNCSSVGLAAHTDKDQLIINGLNEYLEKKYLAVFWNEQSKNICLLPVLNNEYQKITDEILKLNYKIRVLYDWAHNSYFFCAVIIYNTESENLPALVYGSAGGWLGNSNDILTKALEEAYSALAHAFEISNTDKKFHRPDNYNTFLTYLNKNMAQKMIVKLGLESTPLAKFPSINFTKKDINSICSNLSEDIYYIDQSHTLCDFYSCFVFRIIVPSLEIEKIVTEDDLPYLFQ